MLQLVEVTHVAERPTGLLTCTAPEVRRTPALAGGARGCRCREGQGGGAERLLKRGEVLQRSCETGH